MIFKPFVNEWLQRNKKMRYVLAALLSATLVGILAYDRLAKHERITAEKTIDCPELHLGCEVELRKFPYKIATDRPLENGVPFVLSVEGGIVELRANWRTPGHAIAANSTRLAHDSGERWQATMTLPATPEPIHNWILHLEINARAVDIKTLSR
jgi:hypothetical protein